MEKWPSSLVSLFLLLCAVGMMAWHLRSWRRIGHAESDADELDYHYRQFRRRMQTSAMLGILAVGIFAGQWITGPPLLVGIFWSGVLLGVLWLALLALVDIWATRHHYNRLRQTNLVEQAKLQAQVRRIQATRGNGKASRRLPKDPLPKDPLPKEEPGDPRP